MPNEDTDTRIGRVRRALIRAQESGRDDRLRAFDKERAEVMRVAEEEMKRRQRLMLAWEERIAEWTDRANDLLGNALNAEQEGKNAENAACRLVVMSFARESLNGPALLDPQIARKICDMIASRQPKAPRPEIPHTLAKQGEFQ